MDRDDAAFIADALACRIAGDREGLDRLAASSLMRLSTCATVLRKAAAGWRPAFVGAAELMLICRFGGELAHGDKPDAYPIDPELQQLVDSLRKLAGEDPVVATNRAARRAGVARLPRPDRRRFIIPGRPSLAR
jgi:hypothetical protein